MKPSSPRSEQAEHLFSRTLSHCPACGSTRFEAVVESGGEGVVNFRCAECGRCWHVEMGYVHRVDPEGCGGCRYRPQCLALYAEDHRGDAR